MKQRLSIEEKGSKEMIKLDHCKITLSDIDISSIRSPEVGDLKSRHTACVIHCGLCFGKKKKKPFMVFQRS